VKPGEKLPDGAKETQVMSMDVIVDVKPQPLRELRPFHQATRDIPSTIKPEAQIVLHSLLACFEKQKSVKEGIVDDLVFGFEAGGVPAMCTLVGLRALEKEGYIGLKAPDNTPINFQSSSVLKAWVTYKQKLLDMVYDG
jgi:hypothetical protein